MGKKVVLLIVLLVLLVVGAGVMMGQAAPGDGIVEAEKFILRDAEGNVYAELSQGEEEGVVVALTLYDREGVRRAWLSVCENGSRGLVFPDNEGKAGVSLWLQPNNSASLVFFGPGKSQVSLWQRTSGAGGLSLHGKEDESHAALNLDTEGMVHLSLRGREGKATFQVP